MVNLTIGEEKYLFKNEFEDMNVEEFQLLIKYFSDEKTNETLQWVNVINLLTGIEIDTIMNMKKTSFLKLMEVSFNKAIDMTINEMEISIEVDGILFTASTELSVGEIAAIQKVKNSEIEEILSIVFRPSITDEYFKKTFSKKYDHFKNYKQNIQFIKKLNLSVALPFLTKIFEELGSDVNNILKVKMNKDESISNVTDITIK